ncbi:MAG TPA: hypothetical protein VF796_15650, partial [Humisphaera sp.]
MTPRAPEVLAYGPPPPRRRRLLRRVVAGVLLAAAFAAGWAWGPDLWHRARVEYRKRQCLAYAA